MNDPTLNTKIAVFFFAIFGIASGISLVEKATTVKPEAVTPIPDVQTTVKMPHIEPEPLPSVFSNNAMLDVIEKKSSWEGTRSVIDDLRRAQTEHDNLRHDYSDVQVRYRERLVQEASEGELTAYRQRLDELQGDLTKSTALVVQLSQAVTDRFVSEKMKTLTIAKKLDRPLDPVVTVGKVIPDDVHQR